MKRDLWLAMVCGTALLLGACAVNLPADEPETTAPIIAEVTLPAPTETDAEPTEQELAIAQCRAVLDSVQSGTHYKITMMRWYGGIWDTTQQLTYYRSGDDRAIVTLSSDDDYDGEYVNWSSTSRRVSVDGQVYDGYAMKGDPMVWEGPLTDEIMNFDPWMYTFDWDAQRVELQEIHKTEEGRCISFLVDGTYPNDQVLSNNYTISFHFDDEGNFLRRELTATGPVQSFLQTEDGLIPSGETIDPHPITRVDRVTIESLDPDTCEKEISDIYQEAIAYLNTSA